MDQDPKTSTIILILKAQVPPKLHFYDINLKWIQCDLLTHITTSILWTVTMATINLSIHMMNTSEKNLNKKKFLMMRLIIQSLKKNSKKINQISTITSYHLQWTQIPWIYTIKAQTTSLITHNIFLGTAADSYVNTRLPISKQVSPRLLIHKWT